MRSVASTAGEARTKPCRGPVNRCPPAGMSAAPLEARLTSTTAVSIVGGMMTRNQRRRKPQGPSANALSRTMKECSRRYEVWGDTRRTSTRPKPSTLHRLSIAAPCLVSKRPSGTPVGPPGINNVSVGYRYTLLYFGNANTTHSQTGGRAGGTRSHQRTCGFVESPELKA